jgi:hypothetical protein
MIGEALNLPYLFVVFWDYMTNDDQIGCDCFVFVYVVS